MSVKLMAQIWESGPEQQAERFVLLALADFANDSGECWPSILGICGKVCMSERGVQTVIRRLEVSGWLEIETGSGRKGCNYYRLTINGKRAETDAPKMPDEIDRFAIFRRDGYTCVYCGYVGISSGQEAGSDLHVDHVIPVSKGGGSDPGNLVCACASCNISKKNRTPAEWAKNPAGHAPRRTCTPQMDAQTPQMDAQNPAGHAPEPSRTIKNHQKTSSTRQNRFDEFWAVYPKKVGKPAAKKNFDRAVKAGADPGEIIAGANRYAVSVAGKESGFVKHPQGWLTDGRWSDEVSAQPVRQQSEGGGHRSFLRKIAGAGG